MDLRRILTDCPSFADLAATHVDRLVANATAAHVAAGDIVFADGDPARHFYVIADGVVALDMAAPSGPPLVVDTLHGEDLLGWSWLFPPYRWRFTARAVSDTSLVQLDAEALRNEAAADHELGYQLTRHLAELAVERLQATRIRLLDLYGP